MSSSGKRGTSASLGAVEPSESESARKVKRGELSLDEYLDERVEFGVAHLIGKVSDATLEAVRFALRVKLRTDPNLVAAVQQATGLTPEPLSKSERH